MIIPSTCHLPKKIREWSIGQGLDWSSGEIKYEYMASGRMRATYECGIRQRTLYFEVKAKTIKNINEDLKLHWEAIIKFNNILC
jgi:hypothetical protein